MKVCAGAWISLISEKSAIVTIVFNDLAMKMCNQLRTTIHWISFVILGFLSLTVFSFFSNVCIAISVKVLS